MFLQGAMGVLFFLKAHKTFLYISDFIDFKDLNVFENLVAKVNSTVNGKQSMRWIHLTNTPQSFNSLQTQSIQCFPIEWRVYNAHTYSMQIVAGSFLWNQEERKGRREVDLHRSQNSQNDSPNPWVPWKNH